MEAPLLFLYVGLKFAVYTLWCRHGLAKRFPDLVGRQRNLRALLYGSIRGAMGLFLGFFIYLGSAYFYSWIQGANLDRWAEQALTYAAVYIPVRVFEWGIVSLAAFRGVWDWRWIAGGIAISFAADLPMILAVGGLPLGRFMC